MTINKPQTASLIDTISEGYAAINRRPWLVIVPILLNLYLSFGTQLSLGPLINDYHGLMERLQAGAPVPSGVESQSDQLLALGQVDMRQPIAVFNYIPLTFYVLNALGTGGGALGLPMVQATPQLIDARRTDTIQVFDVGGALLAFVVLNALVLPLSVSFLTKLAESVRGDHISPTAWLRRAGRATLAVLGCVGILLGVALALGLPFIFFASLLFWLSPAIGAFVFLLFWVVLFWLRIYIGFAREAIVMHDYGPLRAIYTSFNLVRRNFWGTLGFLAVCIVIMLGSSVIWQMLAGSTVGLVVAIVGSAYVGTGLLAARMAFYRERMRRWQNAPAPTRRVT